MGPTTPPRPGPAEGSANLPPGMLRKAIFALSPAALLVACGTSPVGAVDGGVDAQADAQASGDAAATSADAADAGFYDSGAETGTNDSAAVVSNDAASCCGEDTNCSVNSDCCSGVCLWTGRGAQCVRTCGSDAQCPSGCCTNGSCAPAADWCQSTFTCWPVGHGCANDPNTCCAGTLCADISLGSEPQLLVCTTRCATNADCTSGCCTTFQSGDQLCDQSLACGTGILTCSPVTTEPGDAMSDAPPGDAGPMVTWFPVGSGPYDITCGPDGNLWFTYDSGVARMTVGGSVTDFPIPTASAGPAGITVGPDGNLWFTESNANKIGRITPAGVLTEFPFDQTDSGIFVSAEPIAITAGPDGNLWFTEEGTGKIGRITPDGSVTEFPTITLNSGPWGITSGPDGNLWFAEQAPDGNSLYHIGQITPAGVVAEYAIPLGMDSATDIVSGPDGNLWFTGYSYMGRITPAGVITTFKGAGGSNMITTAPNGTLAYTADVGIGEITTNGAITERYIATELQGITTGPDGNLWFTDQGANLIGRIVP
jgi:streptogramin lyase